MIYNLSIHKSSDNALEPISFNLGQMNLDGSLAEEIYYDRVSKRYKYKDSNQFASREATINLQKKYLSKLEKEFVDLASRIKTGELGLYKELTDKLKRIHISNAIIEKNGLDKLTASDLATVGNILKKQYYSGRDETTVKVYGLKHLLLESPGLSEARLKQRLQLYVQSAELTAQTIRRNGAIAQGYRYAQRFLNPAEHCKDCIYYASLGRQLINVLPLPKTRCECRANCKCDIKYYYELS